MRRWPVTGPTAAVVVAGALYCVTSLVLHHTLGALVDLNVLRAVSYEAGSLTLTAIGGWLALRARARARWPMCLAATMALFAAPDLVWDLIATGVLPAAWGNSTAVGVMYVPAYLALALTLSRMGSHPDDALVAGLLDTVTVTLGVALVAMPVLLQPSMHHGGPVALAAINPVLDLLGLCAIVLIVASRRALRECGLLLASLGLCLGGDYAYRAQTDASSYARGNWVDLLWLGQYVLMAATLVAPSRGSIVLAPEQLSARLRLAFLGGSVVLPAVELCIRDARGHSAPGGSLDYLSAGTALLVVLVLVRLTQLVTEHASAGQVLRSTLAQREQLAADLHHQAMHDALTRLPNRVALMDRAAALVARRGARGAAADQDVLMLVDLDDFKVVNDTNGHLAGDQLLRVMADRLRGAVGEQDLVARLSGDEFAVLLPGVSLEHGLARARTLVDLLCAPVHLDDGPAVSVGASIGVAALVDDTTRALANADIAMYAAKWAGKSGAAVFDPAMREQMVHESALAADLPAAMDDGAVHAVYQPIVRLADGAVVAAEALVRWEHPRMGSLAPDRFLPVADGRGLLAQVDLLVLRDACRAAVRWRAAGLDLRVNVNVSAALLERESFVADVLGEIARAGATTDMLTVEVTEQHVMRDLAAAATKLRRLRRAGVTVALDDFGTGYSSLAYLQQLPVDILKLDKTFVRHGSQPDRDGLLLAAVVELGSRLQLQVLAEGVETAEQESGLRLLGCTLAQGWLWSRPVPADAVAALVRRLQPTA